MFIVGPGSLSTELFYSIHLNRAVLTNQNNLTPTPILFLTLGNGCRQKFYCYLYIMLFASFFEAPHLETLHCLVSHKGNSVTSNVDYMLRWSEAIYSTCQSTCLEQRPEPLELKRVSTFSEKTQLQSPR